MAQASLPTVRWGIVATGLISSWFVEDLVLDRTDAKAKHIVQSVGSSSLEKGKAFVEKHIPKTSPKIYGSYAEVYNDPDVDCVYIGTPHAFHKKNCLDAIAAGKNVLCEKAFTINAAETEEVLAAAKEKGVFVMEAMWTRFYPLVRTLQRVLHEEKKIGTVNRVFCDFGLSIDFDSLGNDSRLKDLSLGAGSLLDIGIYSLTWGLFSLDAGVGETAQNPTITASQTLQDGVDVSTSFVLKYPNGAQAVLTATQLFRTERQFCRIEGSKGSIIVEGGAAATPESFTFKPKDSNAESKVYTFDKPGRGFHWEADAVAEDLAAGRKENAIMPWAETVRVMKIMDEVRRQGGGKYPQDN